MSNKNNKQKSLNSSFLEEELIKHQLGFSGFLKKISPFLRAHHWAVLLLFVVVICYVITGRLMPFLFGYAIDDGIKKHDMSIVLKAAWFYLLVEVMRSALHFIQNFGIQKLGNRILYHLRENLIFHVQSLPLTYFDKNPVGRTVTRVTNDVAALGELFSLGFTAIFVNALEMMAILIAMTFISVRLTLSTTIVAPILALFCVFLSRKIRSVFKQAKSKLATINAFTAESLNGIKILQLFSKTSARQQEFNTYSREFKALNLKTVGLFALLWPILEFFNVITITTALSVGGIYREELGLSIGNLTAFLLMVQSFFQPLKVILERYTQFQNSLASADRIFSLMEELPEPMSGEKLSHDRLSRKIEIRHLYHRYGEKNPWAIKNLSLDIIHGESLALVGRTGSGKTSLISLLQKLYPYTKGSISVEGQLLEMISSHEWRKRVGVVLQENFIFKGTVASNIGLKDPDISLEKIEWAVRESGCDRFVSQRLGGLDAEVEERGANLSVGEKQLIAFARVLAFDPDILILDEATANIDSISEKWIQEATLRVIRERTSIIIAHRLSTILGCDRIALLDKGELIEIGKHEELMSRRGKYYELYTSQYSREKSLASDPDHVVPL